MFFLISIFYNWNIRWCNVYVECEVNIYIEILDEFDIYFYILFINKMNVMLNDYLLWNIRCMGLYFIYYWNIRCMWCLFLLLKYLMMWCLWLFIIKILDECGFFIGI